MSFLAWILLVGAAVLVVIALRLRRATGLPWATVASTDTSSWRRTERPLVSRQFGIVGKPDYLLNTRLGIIPVEVKPSRTATIPYESDLMQLAAYCLLVEEETGRAPQYGLLRYAGRTFRMPYTAAVRDELLAVIGEIWMDREADDVPRSHSRPGRCRSCGFHTTCEDRLA